MTTLFLKLSQQDYDRLNLYHLIWSRRIRIDEDNMFGIDHCKFIFNNCWVLYSVHTSVSYKDENRNSREKYSVYKMSLGIQK